MDQLAQARVELAARQLAELLTQIGQKVVGLELLAIEAERLRLEVRQLVNLLQRPGRVPVR